MQPGEDNETEPGMALSQEWDLEGFWIQDNNNLALVGGFNLITGVNNFSNYLAGDIFIDVDGSSIAGDTTGGSVGQPAVNFTFGYEYVIDIDWLDGSYDVRALGSNSYTQEAWYQQNYGSSPWLYVGEDVGGNNLANSLYHGNFSYATSNDMIYGSTYYQGMNGNNFHNAAYDFNINVIYDAGFNNLVFHNTMGCGNDNLMGATSVSMETVSVFRTIFNSPNRTVVCNFGDAT